MKKHVPSVLFLLIFFSSISTHLSAQKDGFGFRFNRLNYITPRTSYGEDVTDINHLLDIYREGDGRNIELSYFRYLGGHSAISVPIKAGLARVPTRTYDPGRRQMVFNGDVLMQHSLFKRGKFVFNPYIHYGLGGQYLGRLEDWDLNVPFGLGLNIRLDDNVYISAQTQYRVSTDKHHSYQHGVGLVFNFGDMMDDKPKVVDRDGDGVLDINDQCPDLAGLATLAGCPDKDSDGIADKDDKCPDVLGIAALMGCPDKDGDGIADADDACPDQKGIAAFNGCPDTDGDGIQDKDDACPREKGTVSLRGCPDTDGDGIADKDDACPREKGTAENKGCPVNDRDKDGIADKDDACPDNAGTAAGKGCPDTDGDGVYDNDDRCVTKPGPASNKGCPELKQEDKVKLQNVIKNVQFETGSDKLLARSNAVLDEVVAIMNQYPEYSLAISGHTDNVGDEAKNLDLSKRRAKTCYDYLVAKGIAAGRMSHDGYGETRPVADNGTKAGRDTNRRVDFDLTVK
jgi:OmpA-OmpF porin, OOP family